MIKALTILEKKKEKKRSRYTKLCKYRCVFNLPI